MSGTENIFPSLNRPVRAHLLRAHQLWQFFLQPADIAIDATCGNGYDAFFLAPLVKKLYMLDLQAQALAKPCPPAAVNDSIQRAAAHA